LLLDVVFGGKTHKTLHRLSAGETGACVVLSGELGETMRVSFVLTSPRAAGRWWRLEQQKQARLAKNRPDQVRGRRDGLRRHPGTHRLQLGAASSPGHAAEPGACLLKNLWPRAAARRLRHGDHSLPDNWRDRPVDRGADSKAGGEKKRPMDSRRRTRCAPGEWHKEERTSCYNRRHRPSGTLYTRGRGRPYLGRALAAQSEPPPLGASRSILEAFANIYNRGLRRHDQGGAGGEKPDTARHALSQCLGRVEA